MKKISLSLAVIAMMATAAQAEIKSESFGGSASLFYGTNDAGNTDLFNKGPLLGSNASYGNVAVQLGGTALVGSCDTCVKLNYGITGVSTLGLENILVNKTWVDQQVLPGDSNAATPDLQDAIWIDTLNLAFSPLDGISNTTLVVGRQALATPLVFTETWNIAKNTYDAAVAVNNDIADTTLVGAWVGRSNVAGGSTVRARNISDGFESFLTKQGAFAFGAVTTLIPTVTAQAWYYVAPSTTNVAWLQAETEVSGFTLGGQYGMLDAADNTDGNVFAVKAGYNYADIGLSVAYSSVDALTGTSNALGFKNLGGAQSPLYTEAWWNLEYVGQSDTEAISAAATYGIEDIADLGLYVTMADDNTANTTMQEVAVTAGKSIDNLDVTLAYVNSDYDVANQDAVNEVQAYFTYNF